MRERRRTRPPTPPTRPGRNPRARASARTARRRRRRARGHARSRRSRAASATRARERHLTYAAQCAHAENAALRARLGFPPVGAVPNPSLAAPQAPFLSHRRNPRATTPDDFATATPDSTSPPHHSFSPRVNTNSVPTNDDAAEPAALERGHGARDSGRRRKCASDARARGEAASFEGRRSRRVRRATRRPSRADALDFRSMPFGGDDARRRRTPTERRTKTFVRSGRRRRRAYRHTPSWTSRRRNETAFVHSVSRKGTGGGEGPAERPPAAALGREFAERTRSASPSRVVVAADELKNILLAPVPRPRRAFHARGRARGERAPRKPEVDERDGRGVSKIRGAARGAAGERARGRGDDARATRGEAEAPVGRGRLAKTFFEE